MNKFLLTLRNIIIFGVAFAVALIICAVIIGVFKINLTDGVTFIIFVLCCVAGGYTVALVKGRVTLPKLPKREIKKEEQISESPLPPSIASDFSFLNVKRREEAVQAREAKISEREEAAEKRELTLDMRRSDLAQREAECAEREKELDSRTKEFEVYRLRTIDEIIKERNANEKVIDDMEKYREALLRTERRTLEWVKLREAEDITVMDELREMALKPSKYPAREMTGIEFESYVAGLLRNNGFSDVTVTPPSGDFGADVTAKMAGAKYIFQCKYYSSPVGIEAVQEIHSAKMHYNAHVAVVVTNNVFTKAAQTLAEETNVILWDCETLAKMETADCLHVTTHSIM